MMCFVLKMTVYCNNDVLIVYYWDSLVHNIFMCEYRLNYYTIIVFMIVHFIKIQIKLKYI